MNQDILSTTTAKKQPKFIKWSLIVGIVIVLNLFFNYALSLVYPEPKYETYCPNQQVINPPTSETQCVAEGGQWTKNVYPSDAAIVSPQTKPKTITEGYCNPSFTCQKTYDTDTKAYNKNVFIVLIILGIASIAVGIFVTSAEVVSVGLSFGGVLSLIIAAVRYWSEAGNVLKVIMLGLSLVVLIWLGMKKFKE